MCTANANADLRWRRAIARAEAKRRKWVAEIDAVLRETAMKHIADLFADLADEHKGGSFPVAALLEHDAPAECQEIVADFLAACVREGGIVLEGDSVFVADAEIICDAVYRKLRCCAA